MYLLGFWLFYRGVIGVWGIIYCSFFLLWGIHGILMLLLSKVFFFPEWNRICVINTSTMLVNEKIRNLFWRSVMLELHILLLNILMENVKMLKAYVLIVFGIRVWCQWEQAQSRWKRMVSCLTTMTTTNEALFGWNMMVLWKAEALIRSSYVSVVFFVLIRMCCMWIK